MNILIINQPLNNRGDESAHKGLLRTLSKAYPDSNITVFIPGDKDSIRQFNVNLPNVSYVHEKGHLGSGRLSMFAIKKGQMWLCHLHPRLRTKLKWHKWADIVVCAPGGICMGGFQSWGHLFNLKLAKYAHKPLFYYGRSFGPFPTATADNRRFKKVSEEMLHYFTFMSIRDKKSERLADEMGIKYVSTVDSAFLDSPQATMPVEIQQRIGGGKYIVFVPNLLVWHVSFKKVSMEAVLNVYYRMIERMFFRFPNHKIVMLPQTFNYGSWDGDDINLFHVIEEHMKDPRIVVIDDKYSSEIQQSIIRKAECMIGARYHSVVFAINNNTPFIALSYEHKISGLVEALGLQDSMIDIVNVFDSEDKINDFLDCFDKKLKTIHPNHSAQVEAKNLAMKGFRMFQETVQSISFN